MRKTGVEPLSEIMFTGIIEQVGEISRFELLDGDAGAHIFVLCTYEDLKLGESIAVDGVCLTVSKIVKKGFVAELSFETLKKTQLKKNFFENAGVLVNLERALQVGARFGGHFVSGHVDGVVKLLSKKSCGLAQQLRFSLPKEFAPLIAKKGSVTLNGTSLTVNDVSDDGFDVTMIPHTFEVTTWNKKKLGDLIHVEVDLVARYLARVLEVDAKSNGACNSNSITALPSYIDKLNHALGWHDRPSPLEGKNVKQEQHLEKDAAFLSLLSSLRQNGNV